MTMTMLSATEVLAAKSNRKPAQKALTAAEAFGSDMLAGLNSAERRRLEKTAKALKKVRAYYVKKSTRAFIARSDISGIDTVYISDSYSVVTMPFTAYRAAFPDLPSIESGYTTVKNAHTEEWTTEKGTSIARITEDALKCYANGLSFSPTLQDIPEYLKKEKAHIIMCEDEAGNMFAFNGSALVLAEKLQLKMECLYIDRSTTKHVITDPGYPVRMLALGINAPVPEK